MPTPIPQSHHESTLGTRVYPRDDKASTARHPSRVVWCEGDRLVDVLHHLWRVGGVHGAEEGRRNLQDSVNFSSAECSHSAAV